MTKSICSLPVVFRNIKRPVTRTTVLSTFILFYSFQLHAQTWQYGSGTAHIENVNVGIGTSSPETNFHVMGNLAASYSSGFTQLWGDNAVIWKSGTYGLRFGSATNLNAAGFSEKMRITDNGYMGIGTDAPASMLDIVTGVGNGTTNEANCLRLRSSGTIGNSQLLQLGVSNVAAGGSNNGYGYISSVYWGGSENTPLALNPKGGPVGMGLETGINWNATVQDAAAIRAKAPGANNALMGKLVFAHYAPYTGNSAFIAGVYDKSAFSSGAGLVFHTISGSDISGVDGVERMRISSDGNVGIGTNNPTEKLSIQAAADNTVSMALRNVNGTPLLSFASDATAQTSINSYYGLTFNSQNTPAFYSFKVAGNEGLRIDGSGNTGLGVSNPQARLHIAGGMQPASGYSVIYDKGVGANQFYLGFYGDNLSQAFIGQPANVSNRLDFGTGNANIAMTLLDGKTGIGTITPAATLHVNAGMPDRNGASVIFDKGTSDKQFYLCFMGNNDVNGFVGQPSNVAHRLDLGTDAVNSAMTILGTNVGIGTTTPQEKLTVNGTVCATKVRVAQTGCWADYVFNTDYRLRPLSEVEQYINENHHLPEVPSAAEVEKAGLDVSDNQATLLKKIEELTLYVIEQNKKLEAQQQQINTLQKELKKKK